MRYIQCHISSCHYRGIRLLRVSVMHFVMLRVCLQCYAIDNKPCKTNSLILITTTIFGCFNTSWQECLMAKQVCNQT